MLNSLQCPAHPQLPALSWWLWFIPTKVCILANGKEKREKTSKCGSRTILGIHKDSKGESLRPFHGISDITIFIIPTLFALSVLIPL